MSDTEEIKTKAFPFFPVLTLIFVLLKSFGIGPVTLWSWWLVFSPMFVGFAIFFFIIILVALS